MRWSVIVLSYILVSACGGRTDSVTSAPAPAASDWKRVVTDADMARITGWRKAFVAAIEAARAKGNGLSIDREGALLDPDAALGGPGPNPGQYRCRVIKIGAKSPAMPNYTVYPNFACMISDEGAVMGFTKVSGSQRPVGLIFPGDELRHIFLGTMVLGDETRPMEYGRDSMRDMAGAIERIGDNRWRLILPYPHFESVMDVIELVPAGTS
jgi:Domain of unknown function (DUF4893)